MRHKVVCHSSTRSRRHFRKPITLQYSKPHLIQWQQSSGFATEVVYTAIYTYERMRRAQLWGNSLHHVIFQGWEIKSYFHSRFGTLILATVKTTFLYTSWSCLEQHIKHKGRIVPKLAVISPGFYPATLEGSKMWMVFPSSNFVSVIILVKKKSHLHNSTCFTVAFTYHYSFLLARFNYQQVKALRHFFPHK